MLRILTYGGTSREGPISPSSYRLRFAATALAAVWESLHEGLTAARQYEHLRSKGIEHRTAIRAAFGMPSPAAPVGPRTRPPLQQEREPAEPLLCTGSA
jgi:hypothetical protein